MKEKKILTYSYALKSVQKVMALPHSGVIRLEKRKRDLDLLRSSPWTCEPLGSEFRLLEGAVLTAVESRTVGTDERPGTTRGNGHT